MGRPFFVRLMCSGNDESAVHIAVTRDDAVHAVGAGFKVDGAFVNGALFGNGQFEVANNFVALADDQDVLHAVIVGKKDFDVTSRRGVRIGIPTDRRNGFDDEAGVSRNGVIRGAGRRSAAGTEGYEGSGEKSGCDGAKKTHA